MSILYGFMGVFFFKNENIYFIFKSHPKRLTMFENNLLQNGKFVGTWIPIYYVHNTIQIKKMLRLFIYIYFFALLQNSITSQFDVIK